MSDRFTEAFSELEERNPYSCDICTELYGHPTTERMPEHDLHGKPSDDINPGTDENHRM